MGAGAVGETLDLWALIVPQTTRPRAKPVDSTEAYLRTNVFLFLTDADKAIQHSTPFSFPWPLGSQFSMMGLSELKAAINLENDGVASSERQRIMKWTIDDVMSHVRTISPDQAKVFGEQVCTTLENSLILKERRVTKKVQTK